MKKRVHMPERSLCSVAATGQHACFILTSSSLVRIESVVPPTEGKVGFQLPIL